jgi:phage anti-repressor protein
MNLVDFLKTYSKISNEFIDDFFGMYSEDEKYDFSIDAEKVSKWMSITKAHIKETLDYSYKQDIDYKIIKGKKTNKVGKPKDTILLTPKCFKIFAMQSKSKKSVEVREYYYELELLVDRYKNYIIEGMKDKIKKLENNQRSIQRRVLFISSKLSMDMDITR